MDRLEIPGRKVRIKPGPLPWSIFRVWISLGESGLTEPRLVPYAYTYDRNTLEELLCSALVLHPRS